MISLKNRNQGFTIIELLIVIVVIGILAGLVLNSFSGVQARARDADRKSDISAVARQLEVFHGDNGAYPTLANLQDVADGGWVKTNLEGLDVDALTAPNGNIIAAAAAEGSGDYAYIPLPAGCLGVDDATPCTSFTLSADLERSTPDPFTQNSLNN